MRVRVSGLVWVPKAELGNSLAQLKKALTIVPRKSAYADSEPPTPVPCWAETLDEFGLPRDYFFGSAKQQHDIVWELSEGSPISIQSNLRQTGDYAEQALALDTLEAWFRGFDTAADPISAGLHLGAILQADPGFGKTASALELARRLGRTTLIIVHKEFLLTQWQRRIEAFFPDAKIGIVREDVCDFEGKDIVLAMVQSLALEGADGKQRYPLALYRHFGLIVIDECFVAGTMVETPGGPRPIEGIRPGDAVLNAVGLGSVDRVTTKRVAVDRLVVVRVDDGSEFVCTDEHPWLTPHGWTKAAELTPGDALVAFSESTDTMSRHGYSMRGVRDPLQPEARPASKVLLAAMLRVGQGEAAEAMRGVRSRGCEEGESVLFRCLSEELSPAVHGNAGDASADVREREAPARERPRSCKEIVGAHGHAEPNGRSGDQEACVEQAQGNEVSPGEPRRERARSYGSSASSVGGAGPRLGAGTGGSNQDVAGERLSDVLQAGFGEHGAETRDRGGRALARQPESESEGWEKERTAGHARVASVARAERSDLERRGIRVGDDSRVDVFNLSVSGHPSYVLANGLVVHNCHRIGALTWSQVPKMFSAKWLLGLTATPRRRDGADKVFWWNIGQIRYAAKTKRPILGVRMVMANVSGPDILRRDVSPSIIVNVLAKLSGRNRIIVQEIIGALKSPSGRKIMVLSERLEHLRELDSLLRKEADRAGIEVSTGFYTGEWFTGDRSEKLAQGHWDMSNGGRKKAEAAIYTSLSRRKLEPGEDRAVDKDQDGTKVIVFNGGERIPLSDLPEQALYSLARSYDIKQKVTEKKRRRTEEELAEAERARVIWATYQMTSEGIDIPAVDTIGFATPISDVEQSYGRGRRVCVPVAHGGDKTPEACTRLCSWRAATCVGKPVGLAFDVVDVQVPLATRRSKYRREFYESVGARVVDIDTRK